MTKHDLKPYRFQITVRCDARQITHVCVAHTEAEAVERILRSYAKSDPELIKVRHLGILPKPRASLAGSVFLNGK